MDTQKTETMPLNQPKGDTHKGAAIGSAMGQKIGGVADMAAEKLGSGIAAGKETIRPVAKGPVNPTAEHEFWRTEHANRPYFTPGTPYEQYGPAFQYGWQSFASHQGKTFNDVEPQLGRDWETRRGQSKLTWSHAKAATQDAWQRVEKAACGDGCDNA